jgi:hypothetical protein
LVLSVLMLGALALRLQVVWQRTSNVPHKVALRLAGDEIGYEELALCSAARDVLTIACPGAGVSDVYHSGILCLE